MAFREIGKFLLNNFIYIFPIMLYVPPILYMIIARPGIRKGKWIAYLGGLVMLLSFLAPVFGMPHVAYLIIWLFLMPVLLLADAVVWLVTAFGKKTFVIGGICTAVTLLISGIILGNWVSILGAVIFLLSLFLYRFASE
jgi:hypothetical protein